MTMMNRFFIKRIVPFALAAALFVPLCASAQSGSAKTSWLSQIFNWQKPLFGLFQARKDNVQTNSIARTQLLDWRRGVAPIDALSPNAATSSSPVLIPYNVFQEKKTAIVIELVAAENSVKTSESNLSDFMANAAANGANTTAAQAFLLKASADIDDADSAISDFENYEPVVATASGLVDLSVPQAYLQRAISDIQTAKASLKAAITAAGDEE